MKYGDITDHPSNYIYRILDNEELTVLMCVGEYTEVIGSLTVGWEKITDPTLLISIYRYILHVTNIFYGKDDFYILD